MDKRRRYREPAAGPIIKFMQAGFRQIAPEDRDGILAGATMLRAVMSSLTKSHSRLRMCFETRAPRTGAVVEMLNDEQSRLLDRKLAQWERSAEQFTNISHG